MLFRVIVPVRDNLKKSLKHVSLAMKTKIEN